MNGWTLILVLSKEKGLPQVFPLAYLTNHVMSLRPLSPTHCNQRKINLHSSTYFPSENRGESRQVLHEICHMKLVWVTTPSYHFSSQRNQSI